MKFIEMSYDEWAQVLDNPIQRDTERHARLALKNHLKESEQTQCVVSAAELNGVLYKLDGHTRSHLWQTGKLEKIRDKLLVTVYEARDIEEVERLYKTFDNAKAVETATDRLSGAYRACGFNPSSDLISQGGVTAALSMIYGYQNSRALDVYKAVPLWKNELELLDSINACYREITAPSLAAALVTTKIYGSVALEFWNKFAKNLGTKSGNSKDAVQALFEFVTQKKLAKQITGRANYDEIFKKAISAYENYRQANHYVTGIKPTDLDRYFAKHNFFERTDVNYLENKGA